MSPLLAGPRKLINQNLGSPGLGVGKIAPGEESDPPSWGLWGAAG
jgi:hypothetical protein